MRDEVVLSFGAFCAFVTRRNLVLYRHGEALAADCGSFDYASRDETARRSAQDDNFYNDPLLTTGLSVDMA